MIRKSLVGPSISFHLIAVLPLLLAVHLFLPHASHAGPEFEKLLDDRQTAGPVENTTAKFHTVSSSHDSAERLDACPVPSISLRTNQFETSAADISPPAFAYVVLPEPRTPSYVQSVIQQRVPGPDRQAVLQSFLL
jgi:hypothetical protein